MMTLDDPTLRAIQAVRIMSADSNRDGNRLLGILVGVKLGRDHPEVAQDYLIDIGAKMPPESLQFITSIVEYIATGSISDERIRLLIERLPPED